jgi:tetratricopeptide (TPR) repeat protein
LECYDQATDLDASFDNAWFCKGTYLDDLGRYADALACLDEAVRLNPVFSNAWDNRGVTLVKMGKKKDALASFERAILVNRRNSAARANKANLLTGLLPPRRANFEKAAKEATIALEQGGNSAVAWYAYGRAHDGMGHNDEAVRGYTNFLGLSDPESVAPEIGWVRGRLSRIS